MERSDSRMATSRNYAIYIIGPFFFSQVGWAHNIGTLNFQAKNNCWLNFLSHTPVAQTSTSIFSTLKEFDKMVQILAVS